MRWISRSSDAVMARRYAAGDVRLRPCLAQQLAGPSPVPIDVNRPEGATRRSFLRSGALTTLGLWFGGLCATDQGCCGARSGREGRRGRHPAAHERRLLGVRRLAAARDGSPLERVPERLHDRHPHQRLRADDTRDRGARGSRRPGSPRRAGAEAGRAPMRGAAVPGTAGPAHAPREPALGDPAACSGLGVEHRAARQLHAPVGRSQGGTRPVLRMARAGAAAAATRRPSPRWSGACARSRTRRSSATRTSG